MTNEPPIDSGFQPQEPSHRPQAQHYNHPWLKVLIVLMFLSALIIVSAGGSDDTTGLMDMDNPAVVIGLKIAQAIAVLVLFIFPALLFSFLAFPEKLKALKLHIGPKLVTFVLVVVLMIAALPLINWMAEWNNKMTLPESMSGIEDWMRSSEDRLAELTKAFLADTSVGGLMLNLFVIAFMAAVSEELLFRGVIQEVIARATRNAHAAVWITAVLFSVIHLQFFGFFPRMMLGALLGYLFVWSRSLWIPILAHFVNNGLAVILAWMVARKEINPEAENMGSQQGDAIFAIASLLVVSMLLYVIYTYENKKNTRALS